MFVCFAVAVKQLESLHKEQLTETCWIMVRLLFFSWIVVNKVEKKVLTLPLKFCLSVVSSCVLCSCYFPDLLDLEFDDTGHRTI